MIEEVTEKKIIREIIDDKVNKDWLLGLIKMFKDVQKSIDLNSLEKKIKEDKKLTKKDKSDLSDLFYIIGVHYNLNMATVEFHKIKMKEKK